MSKTALVIVHLSSLDAYTDTAGEEAGWDLAENIADAVNQHNGPVIIVDQDWELGPKPSEPREHLLERIEGKPVVRIFFDEDIHDWDPFLRKLRARLKLLEAKEVIIGGIWYDPKLKSGCATEVYLYLRNFFKVKVDPDLVGCE